MPTFIDHHQMPAAMPPEAIAGIRDNIKKGKPDQFGVTGLNVYMAQGEAWCLTESPSADAVVQSHKGMGIGIEAGNVTQVTPAV